MRWSLCCACGLGVLFGAHAEEGRHLETSFREELDALRQSFGLPGVTAAYVMEDGRCGAVAVGVSDLESRQPMTPGNRMLAASIGKTFVSATALMLAAEGRLDLDVPVSDWFGDTSWFLRLPHADKITVRNLLTHRSGLPDHVHTKAFQEALAQSWASEATFASEDLIGFILNLPPHALPGSSWFYSDTGYVIVGLLLEKICGQSLYDEVDSRFIGPLGLTTTGPSNQRDLPGLVPGYTSAANPFGFPVKSTDESGYLKWHPGVESYGGGWVSNSGDLARWGAALYGGRILPEAAQSELRHTLPISDASDTHRYGSGVSHKTEGPLGPSFGHAGWIPGYVSSLRHYSRYGITVAFQINTDQIQGEGDWLSEMELRLAQILVYNRFKQKVSYAEPYTY